ncbi:MAG: phosphoribosylglycinamide formyltransferase [Woeseiaceae bacterium]
MKSRGRRLRAAVLISGSGTNLQAFIDNVAAGRLDIELALVLSNRGDACGLERAKRAGIETDCLPHSGFPDRAAFDAALLERLDARRPDVVLLAGFMRILSAPFVAHYAGRLLNIHPSLLPLYPGLDTHRRVLDSGDRWHGSTVHFVTEDLDGGPRIIQGRVPVLPDDDPGSLARRVLAIEHRIYPETVRLIAEGRVRYADGTVLLDGRPLSEPLQFT